MGGNGGRRCFEFASERQSFFPSHGSSSVMRVRCEWKVGGGKDCSNGGSSSVSSDETKPDFFVERYRVYTRRGLQRGALGVLLSGTVYHDPWPNVECLDVMNVRDGGDGGNFKLDLQMVDNADVPVEVATLMTEKTPDHACFSTGV